MIQSPMAKLWEDVEETLSDPSPLKIYSVSNFQSDSVYIHVMEPSKFHKTEHIQHSLMAHIASNSKTGLHDLMMLNLPLCI